MIRQKRGQPQNINQQKDDMQSVILDLTRVTRVQRGGKRLRFRICVGIGDKKGKVGVGIAKGSDVSIAVEKATRQARKNPIQIPITESGSIPHLINFKHKAAHLLFKPAPAGTGIKAGGIIRILCDLAGLQNISAKILGTNNNVSNARATIKAFQQFKV